MKNIISLAVASALALSMLAGCSAQAEKPDQSVNVDQSPALGLDQSAETGADMTAAESPEAGGRMMINFEGKVSEVKDGAVTLDGGRTVLIGDETVVVDQDGAAAEIHVGDLIQGYAADPDASELEAARILVTAL